MMRRQVENPSESAEKIVADVLAEEKRKREEKKEEKGERASCLEASAGRGLGPQMGGGTGRA
mgnify:CR=1 FL=1